MRTNMFRLDTAMVSRIKPAVVASRPVPKSPARSGAADIVHPDGHDVFMHRRALSFGAPGRYADHALQLARAKALLEVLRTARDPNAVTPKVTAGRPVDAEPSRSVGSSVYSPATYKAQWRDVNDGKAPVSDIEFTDSGVEALVSGYYNGRLSTYGYRRDGDSYDHATLAYIRTFVRAKELGLDVELVDSQTFWSEGWPVNDEAAALLKRAANAFEVAAHDIPYAGSTLDQYRLTSARPALAAAQPAKSKPRQEYDFETSLINYHPGMRLVRLLSDDGRFHAGVHAFIKQSQFPHDLRAFLGTRYPQPPPTAPATEGGYPFTPHNEPAAGPVRDRRPSGASEGAWVLAEGPLSVAANPYPRSKRVFEWKVDGSLLATWATDANLIELARTKVDHWDVLKMPTRLFDPQPPLLDVVNMTARRLELHSNPGLVGRENLEHLLRAELTADSREMALALMRLAKALELPLDQARVKGPTGEITTLAERARELRLPRWPRTDRIDAARVVHSLADASLSLNERVGAFESLQKVDPAAPSFREVITATRQALARGELRPFEWASLSDEQQTRLLDALVTDSHSGVTAVLAGLFLRGGTEALLQKMQSLGIDRPAFWVDFTKQLQGLSPAEALFVTEDAALPSADFSSFSFRMALASSQVLDQGALEKLIGRWSRPSRVRATRIAVEWSMMRGPEQLALTREYLRYATGIGLLKADQLAVILEGRGPAVLDAEALNGLEALAHAVVKAPPAHQAQALDALTQAVMSANSMASENEIVAQLLLRLHQSEFDRVMPLALADQELGGVEAKAWSAPLGARPWGPQLFESSDEVGLEDTRARYPHATHALRLLHIRHALRASSEFTAGRPVTIDKASAEQEAKEQLAALLPPEEKAASKVLLNDFSATYEQLMGQFEQ